jgi:hypothetical protein
MSHVAWMLGPECGQRSIAQHAEKFACSHLGGYAIRHQQNPAFLSERKRAKVVGTGEGASSESR